MKQNELCEEDIKIRLLCLYKEYIDDYGIVPNICNADLSDNVYYNMKVLHDGDDGIWVARKMIDREIT